MSALTEENSAVLAALSPAFASLRSGHTIQLTLAEVNGLLEAARADERAKQSPDDVWLCGFSGGLMHARLTVADAIHESHPIAQALADKALSDTADFYAKAGGVDGVGRS